MHRCTEIYCNVLQCTPNGPSTLASASLVPDMEQMSIDCLPTKAYWPVLDDEINAECDIQ